MVADNPLYCTIKQAGINTTPVLVLYFFIFKLSELLYTDASPPVIENCPASFTVYAEADQVHAFFNYTLPTATDGADGEVTVQNVFGK